MNKEIENEINRTLEHFNDGIDVQVSPLFAESISSRIRGVNRPGKGRYSRAFYPTVIILLLLLNVSSGLLNLQKGRADISPQEKVSILASEYGMAQDDYLYF
jgi:hypothetical protein